MTLTYQPHRKRNGEDGYHVYATVEGQGRTFVGWVGKAHIEGRWRWYGTYFDFTRVETVYGDTRTQAAQEIAEGRLAAEAARRASLSRV